MLSFLMIGQSNMAGRGEMGLLPPIVNPRVMALGPEGWTIAREPVNPDRTFSGESMQLPFADAVEQATGRQIGLIPCAEGGTLLNEWMPGGWLWERAAARAERAMQDSRLSGILWIQGENDGYSMNNAQSYAPRFLQMLDALIQRLGAPQDIPVLVAELCPFLDEFNALVPPEKQVPYHGEITRQLQRLPQLRKNIRCVSAQGLTGKPDRLHYDAPALRALGKRFASVYLREFDVPGAEASGRKKGVDRP